ncbi:hypothetical protein ACFT9I_19825 [Streptomyces sp. NPDC057137]|uniref:hypothetical protein n=1 Tax=Streptomyces sp. NPDC057137 TaxID=3346030 RepID=UPI00363C9A49
MDACLNGLYPDVAARGGLGAAMKEVARLYGYDIEPLHLASDVARIETTRGVVSVGLSTEERAFRVDVHIPGFTWVIGSTGDLELLVKAICAWRKGASLDELETRFEFLELAEFHRALEVGEPALSQWSDLLSSDFYQEQWNLLRFIHSDDVLRNFFPTVTHGAVRLRTDPLDGASRQVLVQELYRGRRYEVLRVGEPEAVWVEVEVDGLLAYLRAALEHPWGGVSCGEGPW